MEYIKTYLLGQADQVTSWVGALGLVGELILHRDPSTLMLAFFVALIALPQAKFSDMFKGWTTKLREYDR
ncbi:MAG: hypothetical protein AB7F35_00820 [Acetobacteraceae bacterium]